MNWDELSRYVVDRINDLYFETTVYRVPRVIINDVLTFLRKAVVPEIGGKYLLSTTNGDDIEIRVVFASGE